ncbi:MAG TPA: CxxC-x17-CxxC domain-containing protein [Chloroflexota bacterium]|nr:CxxC-x17-CxxC domain-containing protein [Chloroflexota bacterium]
MTYTDRTLSCAQCGSEFTFSANDQEFHASRGYQEPKRCPDCRAARRAQNGDYGGSYGGYSDRPRREMFSATCSRCGKEALVPFVPRNDRPVYCSDCYQPAPRNRW